MGLPRIGRDAAAGQSSGVARASALAVGCPMTASLTLAEEHGRDPTEALR